MTSELAIIETGDISPAQFDQSLEYAAAKALSLTRIVEQQKLFTQIGKGKHLRVEAWQTIAMGYGLTAAIDRTEILYDDYNPGPHPGQRVEIGAKSHAVVYDAQGIVRGGAEAYCMCDEGDWAHRNTNQRISMAGTRAISKALRSLLAWVVVLAGYEPTPAEEMTADINATRSGSKASQISPVERLPPQQTTRDAPDPRENDSQSRQETAPQKTREALSQRLNHALGQSEVDRRDMMAWVQTNLQTEDLNRLNDDQMNNVIEAVLAGLP